MDTSSILDRLRDLGRNKTILFGSIIAVVILVFFASSLIPRSTSSTKANAPKGLTIWEVGDETSGYSSIITGFQSRYPEYKNLDIKVTMFATYRDYQENLLNVLADGNGPDIFVLHNNGGTDLLRSKAYIIPNSVISVDEFSQHFNKLFDELVVRDITKDTNVKIKSSDKTTTQKPSSTVSSTTGGDKSVQGVRGVPMGYQALGIFYNYKLVKNVPTTWSELDHDIATASSTGYSTIAGGLGSSYVTHANDFVSLLMLQNGINGYDQMTDAGGTRALSQYMSYQAPDHTSASSADDFSQFRDDMDKFFLRDVDLFAREKVGMVVGYPSTLPLIEQAIKRTKGDHALSSKFLRSAPVPQMSSDPKKSINLADYQYFVLSRTSKSPDLGFQFLAYLAEKGTQEKYMEAFSSMLPAYDELGASIQDSSIGTYDRVKYAHFMKSDVSLSSFDKGLALPFDEALSANMSLPHVDMKSIAQNTIDYVTCKIGQMIDQKGLDQQCVPY